MLRQICHNDSFMRQKSKLSLVRKTQNVDMKAPGDAANDDKPAARSVWPRWRERLITERVKLTLPLR
jgi:hypothetical protein